MKKFVVDDFRAAWKMFVPVKLFRAFQKQGVGSGSQTPLEHRRNPRHHNVMLLTLPENLEARLSPQSTALHLAIGLFVSDESTLGQAAKVAGLSQADFLRELGQRRIPIHYSFNELAADLQAVDELAARG